MRTYSSWVHGSGVLLERANAAALKGKTTVRPTFHGHTGDIVNLGRYISVACVRLSWGARLVPYDNGEKNREQSGSFWVHFAIPTPVVEHGDRAVAGSVVVNYESSDINAVSLDGVQVWDGNRRIFVDDSPVISGDDYDGGIPGSTTDATKLPNTGRLWRGNIPHTPIFFGVCVSLHVRAHAAKNDHLEIRGVGVDFQIRD